MRVVNKYDICVYVLTYVYMIYKCISGGANGKEPACQCRRHKRHRFDPWVGKIPWRRAWQSTSVFLPGESHGQRSLAATVHRVANRNDKQFSMHTHRTINWDYSGLYIANHFSLSACERLLKWRLNYLCLMCLPTATYFLFLNCYRSTC